MKSLLINIKFLVYSMIATLLMISCKSDDTINIDYSQYYPLKINGFSIYEVKEEIYVAGRTEPEILSYYEKHVVKELSTDSSGVITATLNIYTSPQNTDIDNWKEESLYFVEKRLGEILIIKNGTNTSILKHPLKVNNRWNLNDFNEENIQVAVIQEVGNVLTLNGRSWENVVKVQQREKSTLIDYYNTAQYFAPTHGLVYEVDAALEYCQDNNCIGDYVIESGYKIERTLIQNN